MGLALNSDEVQRNLALLPVADNVSVCVCVSWGCVFVHLTTESVDALLEEYAIHSVHSRHTRHTHDGKFEKGLKVFLVKTCCLRYPQCNSHGDSSA